MLAAVLYIAGVGLFSTWSYRMHRNKLRNHCDNAQITSAHAVREILGNNADDCIAILSNTNSQTYANRKEQLNRYACQANLAAIVAIAEHNGTTHILSTGTTHSLISPSSLLDERKEKTAQGLILKSITHPDTGHIRIAATQESGTNNSSLICAIAFEQKSTETELMHIAMEKILSGLVLLALAVLVVMLGKSAEHQISSEAVELNVRLKQDAELQKQHEKELKEAIQDLKRFNTAAVGRESRIIELKTEINNLLEEQNREKRYSVETVD